MVRSTWSMWVIFRLPTLTWRKQVQSFPLLLRTLLSHKYFIYLTVIEWVRVRCEELCRSRRSMPSFGYVLHRLPNIVTVCRLWGFSDGLETIRNGEIFWINNNKEETRLFHFVGSITKPQTDKYRGKVEWSLDWNRHKLVQALSHLNLLLVNHFSEKGLTTKWFLLVKPFKYVAHQYYSPCSTDLQRTIFIYFL